MKPCYGNNDLHFMLQVKFYPSLLELEELYYKRL